MSSQARKGVVERLDHAVVVGGSVAGLLAASALASHAQRVTLIERDAFPEDPDTVRKGAPQGRQPHVLLDRGRRAMDQLLPGLFDDLAEQGSVVIDFGRQVKWYHSGGWKANCATPYRLFMQTRPFLELHARRRLLDRGNVTLLERTELVRPSIRDGRIHGVEVRSLADDSVSELACDLLVDATGRGSRSPRWLEAAGYDAPPEQSIRIDLCYATRLYRPPAGFQSDWKALAIYGRRPAQRRHAVLFTVEGGRWLVTLMGYEGDHPPAEPERQLEFARSLERPELYDLLCSSEATGDVYRYKVPTQRWRRYDRLDRMPAGYVVIGDGICSFDPVFAQGMTIAALEAEMLEQRLREGSFDALAFAKATRQTINVAWLLSSLEAHRYPTARQTRPVGVGLLHRLADRVFACANDDPVVYRALVSIMHMDKGPGQLLKPSMLARFARGPQGDPAPPSTAP